MTVAAATRAAVRNRPALYDALRAGVVNYTAAADSLDVDGERDAIATALRRFADELADQPPASLQPTDRSVTVRLHSDIDPVDCSETLLAVDEVGISHPTNVSPANNSVETEGQTALRVTGAVDVRLLAATLDRLRIAEIPVEAAGIAAETMVIVVPRRDGPTAVQLVEAAVDYL